MSKQVTARTINGTKRTVDAKDMSFRVSIYGVVIQDHDVLLVPQWDGYDIPGGGVELGETNEEAIKREVFEETGIVVEPNLNCLLHITEDFFIHPTDGKAYHYILLYYPCRAIGGSISTTNFEADEKEYAKAAKWVPIKEVDKLKFFNPIDSPSVIKAAEKLLEN